MSLDKIQAEARVAFLQLESRCSAAVGQYRSLEIVHDLFEPAKAICDKLQSNGCWIQVYRPTRHSLYLSCLVYTWLTLATAYSNCHNCNTRITTFRLNNLYMKHRMGTHTGSQTNIYDIHANWRGIPMPPM